MSGNILILHLETSENLCAVGLSLNGEFLGEISSTEANQHGKVLHTNIVQLLAKYEYKANQLSAVSISKGPGSYTGLRIGAATAKGLSYSLGIPLFAISTLELWATLGKSMATQNCKNIIPLMDARRMEVYVGYYSDDLQEFNIPESLVITTESFQKYMEEETCFIGSGSKKVKELFHHIPKWEFILEGSLSTKLQNKISFNKFKKQEFENIFLFEPFYLKEAFITSKSS